jgi:hypothetical protein
MSSRLGMHHSYRPVSVHGALMCTKILWQIGTWIRAWMFVRVLLCRSFVKGGEQAGRQAGQVRLPSALHDWCRCRCRFDESVSETSVFNAAVCCMSSSRPSVTSSLLFSPVMKWWMNVRTHTVYTHILTHTHIIHTRTRIAHIVLHYLRALQPHNFTVA